MAANRQTYIHTHARAQCSHASVGLAQARPNQANHNRQIPNTLSHVHPMQHSTCNIFAGNKHVTLPR